MESVTSPTIRAALTTDALAVARVHVRSWQVAYSGLLPAEYLDSLRPEHRAARYTFELPPPAPATLVAIDGERICGFATTGESRDDDTPGFGQLLALYVHPEYWSTGVGRALISAARNSLAGAGYCIATLWVLTGNKRAERFYLADGWRPDGRHRTDTIGGATVEETSYRRQVP